jgi:hypothetical protein
MIAGASSSAVSGLGGNKPDAQGRVLLPALIPGATLWLSAHQADGVYFAVHKEFKVAPGKTIDLGDIVVKKQRGQ